MTTAEKNKLKRKVRASKEWKDLRKIVYDMQNGLDPISNKKLPKHFIIHHLSQVGECYDDLNPNKFVALGRKNHDFIHRAYELGLHFTEERVQHILDNMYFYTMIDLKKIS